MAYKLTTIINESRKAHIAVREAQHEYDAAYDAASDAFERFNSCCDRKDFDSDEWRDYSAAADLRDNAYANLNAAQLYANCIGELALQYAFDLLDSRAYSPEFLAKHDGQMMYYKRVVSDLASVLPADHFKIWHSELGRFNVTFYPFEDSPYINYRDEWVFWGLDWVTKAIDATTKHSYQDSRCTAKFSRIRQLCKDAPANKERRETILKSAYDSAKRIRSEKSAGLQTLATQLDTVYDR